jgi:hypothetical protein
LGDVFIKYITEDTVLTFSNLVEGKKIKVILMQTGRYTVTFPALFWEGGFEQPVATQNVKDMYDFIYTAAGILGTQLSNFGPTLFLNNITIFEDTLEIDVPLNRPFNPGIFEYTASMPVGGVSVKITGYDYGGFSEIKINGETVALNMASSSIVISPTGNTIIAIQFYDVYNLGVSFWYYITFTR